MISLNLYVFGSTPGVLFDKVLKISTVLLFIFGLAVLDAQETISATGSSASVSGIGSVSYTVGQVVYTVNTGTTGSLVQGVQQPFEISVMSGIEESGDIQLQVSVYPNPATDYLSLRVDDFEISCLSFQLFDIGGTLLEVKELTGNETTIDFSHLVPSVYYLKVVENNKEIRTFKIIKY